MAREEGHIRGCKGDCALWKEVRENTAVVDLSGCDERE